MVPISAIILNERNTRKHPKEQIARLERGIAEHGFLFSVLLNDEAD